MDFSDHIQPAANDLAGHAAAARSNRLDELYGQLPAWLLDDAKRLQRHERFHAAVTLYAERVLKNFRKLPFLARIMSGEARYLLCTALIAYHYTRNPLLPDTYATVSRLQHFATRFQIASPNRVVALLALMQFAGAVQTSRSQTDRRVKLVDFSEAAIAHGDKMALGTLLPLRLLSPHDYEQAWNNIPGFRGRYYSECLRLYSDARFVALLTEIDMLSTQDAAGELKFKLWLGLANHATDAPPILAFPYGQIAREFGVSRAHVRRIFEKCQEKNLLILHQPGGLGVEFLPAFSEALLNFVSLEIALMMRAADFAMTETATPGSMAWLHNDDGAIIKR